MQDTETHREIDQNGYLTVKDNPITRAGVFQYKGSQLPDADPERIYNVYRPLEELENPEALESMRGLPIINDHEMLGDKYERSPEERGVHGSILESIKIVGDDVLANLRIWSRTLKNLIESGKTGLSLGYKCKFEKSVGIFNGMQYDYIQRNIRGNHLALVNQGRSGTAVLDKYDVFDHFDIAIDIKDFNMADEEKKVEATTENKSGESEMTIAQAIEMLKKIVPQVEELTAAMTSKKEEEKSEMALDGDTEKKDGDQKAEDEEKDKEKKEAMDAAIERAVNSRVSAMASKFNLKSIMADASRRDSLAKELVPHVGSFDHSAMDADDVASYGVKKLGLEAPKGQEHSVLRGYLAGVKKSTGAYGIAMDSTTTTSSISPTGKLAKRLNG